MCKLLQLCVDSCTTGALSASKKWAFGTSNRKDLILDEINPTPDNKKNKKENNKKDSELKKSFKKSLHIRHVDAGSVMAVNLSFTHSTTLFIILSA